MNTRRTGREPGIERLTAEEGVHNLAVIFRCLLGVVLIVEFFPEFIRYFAELFIEGGLLGFDEFVVLPCFGALHNGGSQRVVLIPKGLHGQGFVFQRAVVFAEFVDDLLFRVVVLFRAYFAAFQFPFQPVEFGALGCGFRRSIPHVAR